MKYAFYVLVALTTITSAVSAQDNTGDTGNAGGTGAGKTVNCPDDSVAIDQLSDRCKHERQLRMGDGTAPSGVNGTAGDATGNTGTTIDAEEGGSNHQATGAQN